MSGTRTASAPRGRARSAAVLWITGLSVLWLACSPKVGSDAWCAKMKETPKADWSTREAGDFTKHCIFK